jgi:hypothetical protein
MDKYLEAEKRLAELLGYEIKYPLGHDFGPVFHKDGKVSGHPKWCRDWNACGPLMVEHEITPHPKTTGCLARSGYAPDVLVLYSDHPDEDAAVRFAIVHAVIAKLEAEHEHNH